MLIMAYCVMDKCCKNNISQLRRKHKLLNPTKCYSYIWDNMKGDILLKKVMKLDDSYVKVKNTSSFIIIMKAQIKVSFLKTFIQE